jgi:hypothetical protein
VVGNLGISPTETPNTPWPEPYRDANLLERYEEYCDHPIDGERAWVFYTEIQKKYKYPEFEGEKYMTPCVAFDRMAAAGYITRYFQDIIWVCNYLDDGLTLHADTIYVRNPRGYGLTLHERMVFANFPFPRRFKSFYSFYCELQDKYSYQEIASFIHADVKLMYLISIIYKAKRKLTRT